MDSIFQMGDIVSIYTDAQAIEDGLLVSINPRGDRVTRAVWEYLVEKAPKTSEPPSCWPVEMLGWFRAEAMKREDAQKLLADYGREEAQKKLERIVADRKALALSKGVITEYGSTARRVYDNNEGGGIFKIFATERDGFLSGLTQVQTGKILWLLPNENGGITLLFPEDY